jgi:hypothetical protein
MHTEERDLLRVLKQEMEFLEKGEYARAQETSWRPILIFEDSPICLNHDYKMSPVSCGDCALMQLVPPELRSAKFPCRHIPLNTAGETPHSLYRHSETDEIAKVVKTWLQATIAQLEEQQDVASDDCGADRSSSSGKRGLPLQENAKCANPACPVLFHWRKGGKFFRFRDSSNQAGQKALDKPPAGVHGVRHYWFCERCSHVFTLAYEEHSGVVLRILPGALAISQSEKELPAA